MSFPADKMSVKSATGFKPAFTASWTPASCQVKLRRGRPNLFYRKNYFDGQSLFKDSPKALLVFAFSFLKALFTATLRLCPRQFNHDQPRSPTALAMLTALSGVTQDILLRDPQFFARTPLALWLATWLCGHQEHVPLRVTLLAVSNLQLHSEQRHSCR